MQTTMATKVNQDEEQRKENSGPIWEGGIRIEVTRRTIRMYQSEGTSKRKNKMGTGSDSESNANE